MLPNAPEDAPNLSLANHVYRLDALNGSQRGVKGPESLHGSYRRLTARWSCSTTLFRKRTGRQRQSTEFSSPLEFIDSARIGGILSTLITGGRGWFGDCN